MKRFLAIAMVAVVVAGSWLLYAREVESVTPEHPEGYRTEPVTRGSLEAIVGSTGSLAAERSQSLVFATGGRVVEVLVNEGDTVAEDQVLARLDDSDVILSLKQAEAALHISEAQLAKVETKATAEDIEAARAAIGSAKASLADLLVGPSERERRIARLSIDQARNSLWGAQANRDAVKGSRISSGGQKDQAEAQVLNAEVGVLVAEIQHDQLLEPPKASAVSSAESQIAQAEANLARLLSTPSQEDVALAMAQVEQARVNVEIARDRLQDLTLTSPFSGQLSSWDPQVGDLISPGVPVGTLLDISAFHIEVTIDETEIAKLKVGQSATVELDAFAGETCDGVVSRLELVGNNAQGIVTYGVRVDLQKSDRELKPLMTAVVDIIVDRREDVLVVPNRALRRDRDGKYVEILRLGIPTRVAVETGVSDVDFSEVVSGLEEGQQVVVARPRENMFAGGPFGG